MYLSVLFPVAGKLKLENNLAFEGLFRLVHDCQNFSSFKASQRYHFPTEHQEFIQALNKLKYTAPDDWREFQRFISMWIENRIKLSA
jgi:hypothetical protein